MTSLSQNTSVATTDLAKTVIERLHAGGGGQGCREPDHAIARRSRRAQGHGAPGFRGILDRHDQARIDSKQLPDRLRCSRRRQGVRTIITVEPDRLISFAEKLGTAEATSLAKALARMCQVQPHVDEHHGRERHIRLLPLGKLFADEFGAEHV